ncbi:heavy-metal-associated domain-containing protein [Streptococcus gallolyticus]|uniref:heavy-metal-associated domain-containing protein n=1 Tax=Streptococcus hepaticus TaxID=3349163 RepID=UPI001C94EFA9|nr:heavy-metal-associated domain-containing protein [Streptococcus gallolyticus]MBY5040828.1 heavy-metal-associated domain-containing protein [Streptococcus gallolyticus]
MKQTLMIENMSCQNCAKHVMEHLSALVGVESVQVELEAKQVVVETTQEYSCSDYQLALEDTIYEVKEVN